MPARIPFRSRNFTRYSTPTQGNFPSGVAGSVVIVANATGLPPSSLSLAENATFDLDAIVYDAADMSVIANPTVQNPKSITGDQYLYLGFWYTSGKV